MSDTDPSADVPTGRRPPFADAVHDPTVAAALGQRYEELVNTAPDMDPVAIRSAVCWCIVHMFGTDLEYVTDATFHAQVHLAAESIIRILDRYHGHGPEIHVVDQHGNGGGS